MTVGTGDPLEEVLVALLRTPTSVPPDATEVPPGAPAIVAAVEDVLLPWIEALGPAEVRRHPLGDVAARFGPPGDDGLLLQTYVVSQHGNLMADPLGGHVVDGAALGLSGRVAVGQGATQNKGPMAAVLAALGAVSPGTLQRPVWLAVNTEGQSSHGGSRRVIDDLGVRAAWGVVAIGTDLRVSLGNRGRVDVDVTVAGESCHSSQPELGSNPIEGAADVVAALRAAPVPPPHAELGPARVTPYQVAVSPIAPHTIPARAHLVVDRRLLPGETAAGAVAALRAHLERAVGAAVDVREGVSMLPAAVAADAAVVLALQEGVARARPGAGGTFWSRNTFDAGYACAQGIPTVMFGPGRRDFSSGVTQAEAVALDDCRAAAAALAHAITALCA